MKKEKKIIKETKQYGGVTHKKDNNAGSGAFNQGAEQDPRAVKEIIISDEEKRTGHSPSNLGHQRPDPADD